MRDKNSGASLRPVFTKKISIDWVTRFFELMEINHPFVWRKYLSLNSMSSSEMQMVWFDELKNTSEQKFLSVTRRVCDTKEFSKHPPYLAQMKDLCSLTTERWPSEEAAYKMFLDRTYKESAPIRHALKNIDSFSLRNFLPGSMAKSIFLEAYRRVIEKIKGGDLSYLIFTEKPQQIALPSSSDLIGIENRGRSQSDLMSSMRKSLGIKS